MLLIRKGKGTCIEIIKWTSVVAQVKDDSSTTCGSSWEFRSMYNNMKDLFT